MNELWLNALLYNGWLFIYIYTAISKGIVCGFEFTSFKEINIWKTSKRGCGLMFARAKGKQQK